MAKRKKKPNPRNREITKQVRVNQIEFETIQANADRHCKGDLSKWFRFAGMNFHPKMITLSVKPATRTAVDA